MAERAHKAATYEDLCKVEDTKVAELIGGELFVSPRPAGPQTVTAGVLQADLGASFMRGRGGPGGWWIVVEPEVHFGPDVLVPDLAGWRRERLPEYPRSAFVELAPDWVCEVLSPTSRMLDRVRKKPVYAQHGVRNVWLVDPELRTLDAFVLNDGQWTVTGSFHEAEPFIRAEPFDAIELDLAALFDLGSPNK